jgi:hypothetical protein
MGTGSFGGSGGGGSGRSSIRGIWYYHFENGKPSGRTESGTDAKEEIKNTLRKFSKDYVNSRFGSPLVKSSYEEIFSFSKYLEEENPCEAIATEYGVEDGKGFLPRWIAKIIEDHQEDEPNTNIRDLTRMCLEDFFLNALNNDIKLYLEGNCAEVLAKLNTTVLESTSGYFLGQLIRRILECEYEQQQPEAQTFIQKQSQILADQIIKSFEREFIKKGEFTYRDFFKVVQKKVGWFMKELS